MTISSVIENAVEQFHAYIAELEIREFTYNRRITVEELIIDWFFAGEAVLDCHKDHHIFLSAVAVIFAEWHDQRFSPTADESRYQSSIPWFVTQARVAKADMGQPTTNIFDPYEFQAQLCRIEESKELEVLQRLPLKD